MTKTSSNTYLISIVIPVFNQEKYIKDCLLSCINQTYTNIEVIVVNDGSNDNSVIEIKKISDQDQRIKIVEQRNQGVNIARRVGLKYSNGDYIFFMDSDDLLPTNSINSLVNNINSFNIDIVAGDVKLIYPKGTEKIRKYSRYANGSGEDFLTYLLENQLHYLWGKLYSKKLLTNEKIEFHQLPIGEDQILLCQLGVLAREVKTTNEICYYYKLNNESVTRRDKSFFERSKEWEMLAIRFHDIKTKFKFKRKIRKEINRRILWNLQDARSAQSRFIHFPHQSRSILISIIKEEISTSSSLFLNSPSMLIRLIFYPLYFRVKKVIFKHNHILVSDEEIA